MERKEDDETKNLNWPNFVGSVSQDKNFDFYDFRLPLTPHQKDVPLQLLLGNGMRETQTARETLETPLL